MTEWSGRWVADRLRVTVRTSTATAGVSVADLVGLAVRRNPRRTHLLVSTVLGKHVPTDPRLIHAAGGLLGLLVSDVLADRPPQLPSELQSLFRAALGGAPADELARALWAAPASCAALVLGYAETATALGHSVADILRDADYVHSTRRRVAGIPTALNFEEEHSHATSHRVLPTNPYLLQGSRPLVLVDDEISTGRTVLNTINALQRVTPRERYVVAALVDLRSPADQARFEEAARSLDTRIDVVSLAAGAIDLPADLPSRSTQILAEVDSRAVPEAADAAGAVTTMTGLDWPVPVPTGGRHGFTPADRDDVEALLPIWSKAIAAELRSGARVLVLGFEELMYLPMRLAETLANDQPDITVRSSATTRSPVLAVPDEGYPIQHALVFPAHDGADGKPRFVYNVRPSDSPPWDVIVQVVDAAGATDEWRGGLIESLRPHARHVLTVTVPA